MMIPKTLTWVRGPFAGKTLIEYCYFMKDGDPLAKLDIDIKSAGLNTVVSVTGPDWFLDIMDEEIVKRRF